MLFQKLEICNFQCFYQNNVVEFPDLDAGESSLILVLGPNSAGKSTIIRSLKFLFYGDLLGHNDEDAFKLVNDRHRATAKGDRIEGSVRATVLKGEEKITFQRTIQIVRSGGSWRYDACMLHEVKRDARRGDVFHEDQGSIAREIERVVPHSLFDYFYFAGEEIAGTLLGGASSSVASGIETLLHLDDWDTAIKTIQAIQRKFEGQRDQAGALNEQYLEAERALSFSKNQLKEREASLKKCQQRKTELDGRSQMLSDQLKQLATGTPHEKLAQQHREAQARILAAEADLTGVNDALAREVGRSAGLPFLAKAFPVARKLLEQMHEENLLPADFSVDFVDHMLERKKCICERSLDPKADSKACAAVVAYRERSLSSQMNSALQSLLKHLNPTNKKAYGAQISTAVFDLGQLLDQRNELLIEQKTAQAEESNAARKLAEAKVDEIQRVARAFRECKEEAEKCAGQMKEDDIAIRNQTRRREEAQKVVDKLRPKAATPELTRIQKCLEIAENLERLIEDSRDVLEKSFRETMQRSVSEYYDKHMTDGSRAHIDAATLLPFVKTSTGESRTMAALGGGQKQLLALAHIFSLCQLRRTLHEQLVQIGIGVGHLDDQSFFLDSIFAPTDKEYGAQAAGLLLQKAHQIVLLLASQQWHEGIRPVVEPAVSKVYRLHVHTANPDTNPKEYQMPYKKTMIQTLTKIQDGCSYTKLEEVK